MNAHKRVHLFILKVTESGETDEKGLKNNCKVGKFVFSDLNVSVKALEFILTLKQIFLKY